MPATKKGAGKGTKRALTSGSLAPAPVSKIRLTARTRRPAVVRFLDMPPTFKQPKRIHPRRVLPLVREGAEREYYSTTPRTILVPYVMRAAPAPSGDIVVRTNTELTQPALQQTASNVDEPSCSLKGNVAFYTGNWYAATSANAGATFQYIDPATAFKAFDPPNAQFCCDQVVNYIPSIDTFVWLMQYVPEQDNFQRLAFATSGDVAQGNWHLFDVTTALLGVPGAFLDFPDLAVGANYLYVTTNIFFPNPNEAGSAVLRIPIQQIASGKITAERFISKDFQSFRVAQNCGTTAYFAAHQDTSTLAVFSWDESQAVPTPKSVGVARWVGGNGYVSRTPDGRRWLDRADPRITGATLANGELWFAWSVDRGSNQRALPFVQIARIRSTDLTLIENLNIFDVDSAICYGALATNADSEVGISYAIGGGPRYPSHAIGMLTNTRKDLIIAQGNRGPLPDPQTGKGEWGDFLTIRPVFPDRKSFVATGYTMKGAGDGSNRDATPRFVVFARAGGGPGPGGGNGGGPADPSPVGPGPITDVNTLPVVSSGVAAEILKAAGIGAGPPALQKAQAMPAPLLPPPELVTSPGRYRWPVKTGTDQDVAKVGKNVIAGKDLGAGIVPATLEELVLAPRPSDMPVVTQAYPAYNAKREAPVETTLWRVDATITAMSLEQDGDYHLVLQGASGETMIAEIPTPTPQFVGTSPWINNIGQARKAIDDKFVTHLAPAAFVPMGNKLVPREAISRPLESIPTAPESFLPPPEDASQKPPPRQPFKTQVPPTKARITGVGFFDTVHGQAGVSQFNGIELHPVLKVEWI